MMATTLILRKENERLALEASMEEKTKFNKKELAWVKRVLITTNKTRLQRFDELVNKDTYTQMKKWIYLLDLKAW